jgi:outer membrane protein OmpA-like peptidoglycan-associated protein
MILRTTKIAFLVAVLGYGAIGTAAAADCPPIGKLPNYIGEPKPELHNHNSFDFKVKPEQTVSVAGKKCFQTYRLKDGAQPMSDLEIQNNYREQIKKLGGQILFNDDRNVTARIAKDTQETWIAIYGEENLIEVTVIEKAAFKSSLLPPSGGDYRLVGRMPNFAAGTPEKRNFDKATFKVQAGDEASEVQVAGAKHFVTYKAANPQTAASPFEVQENYKAAALAAGGQIVFSDNRLVVARLEDKGQSIWLSVYAEDGLIELTAIEEKPFQSSIQPPTANALKTALDKDGRIALYVNFDFNKATLKPDAAPVIEQVVRLLKDNPSLRLEIGGHTDNIGARDYNVKLSGSRAASVVSAIAAQGVDAKRLNSAGYGPDKPVAANDTDEGRAKNRRVELVKS